MSMILLFLKSNWRWIAGVLAVVALVLAVYGKGRNDERQAWKAKYEKALIAAAQETQRLVEKNYVIEQKIVATIVKERVITKTLTEQVPVYVSADACPLPGGYRLLHDAAARGDATPAPAGTDAPAVPAQDAATTVIENYGACRQDQARLTSLQEWVRIIASAPILCPQ